MTSTADFSPCQRYRYRLTRRWGETSSIAFLMLNPSTADADRDDPTVRRCIGFAKDWGHGGLEVYNIFALRATDPRELREVDDPIGPENDAYLARIPADMPIIAAWGNWGQHKCRGFYVHRAMQGRLRCLGTTSQGQPKHPLYVAAETKPVEYRFSQ